MAFEDDPGGGDSSAPRRRRGEHLENALLDAAWEELTAVGYPNFTMEAVAARANTSRAVLYRRWPNRWELAVDAAHRMRTLNPVAIPDTGSVREDLLHLLREMSWRRGEHVAILTIIMADAEGTTPAQLRERFLAGGGDSMGVILQRGVERGEVDPQRLTGRIASVPADLVRHDLIMTLTRVPEERLVEIVDHIFLPLVRPEARKSSSGASNEEVPRIEGSAP